MGLGLVMMYAEMRPRSRADPAADPRNAAQKLRGVRRCHLRRWPPVHMVPMSAVSGLVKGMLKEHNCFPMIWEVWKSRDDQT